MEKLSSAELATRVKAVPPKNEDKHYDRGLDQLMEAAKKVVECLRKSRFEETDAGYVEIVPVDTSDYDYNGAIYGEFEIYYIDQNGYGVQLGSVDHRSAKVNVSPYDTEPLYPNDERWDAVVGALGRAVLSCETNS